MFKLLIKKSVKGFTLVEVIIACTIITVTILFLMSAATKSIELSNRMLKDVQANFLLEEGAEAVKTIRDNSWANISGLTLNSNYYLSFDDNNNVWSLTDVPISPIDDVFNRVVSFEEVYRNNEDDIEEGGSLDENIKKVKIMVSWPTKDQTINKELTFYLANIFN